MNNSFHAQSKLFVEKEASLSQEGTTQGDPLAIAMYGIAMLPLISYVQTSSIVQNWYAEGGSAANKLMELLDFCLPLSQWQA